MRRLIPILCLSVVWTACGGSQSVPATSPQGSDEGASSVQDDSWLVSRVPRGTFGPHWASRGKARLAVWAVPHGEDAGWYTLVLPEDRAPATSPLRVADVAEGLELVRLCPDGAGGFALLTVRREGERFLVEAFSLGPEGVLRAGPAFLGESPAPIVWLDAAATSRGALAVWAERANGRADLYAVPVGPLGGERPARRVARGILAWQMAAFGRSVALGMVEEGSDGRDITVRFIGDDGEEAAPAVTLAKGTRANPDLDLVVAGNRTVVAWTEQREFERRLVLAQLGSGGALTREPHPATPPRGNQALVELVAAREGSDVYVVWDEASHRPLGGNGLLVGRVNAQGELTDTPTAQLEVHGYDGTLPVFAAHPDGLFVATRAPRCREQDVECDGSENILVTDLDRELRVRGASPVDLQLNGAVPAHFLWDLHCDRDCWALTARAEEQTFVFLNRLEPQGGWRAPVTAIDRHALPRMHSQSVVGEVLDLAALEGWGSGEGPLVAWLSYFDPSTPWVVPDKPAPDGKRAPVRAILRTQLLGAGAAVGESSVAAEETISWRAHSLGGIARVDGKDDQSLLVWSALDNHQPQVFATLVDARGKKLRQRMITNSPGEVMDVTAARLDEGWLVAWIDGRGSNFEVYVQQLDERLESRGKARVLAEEASSPAGIRLLRRGERVFAVWSDIDGLEGNPYADIYLSVLSAQDGSELSPPRRVANTKLHSHSPRLVPWGEGALVSWLESEPELDRSGQGAWMVLELSSTGRSVRGAQTLSLDAHPTGFALTCESKCRTILTVDAGERHELWAMQWVPGASQLAEQLRFLTALDSHHSNAVAPVLLGDDVYYADADPSGRFLLRRLGVVWER